MPVTETFPDADRQIARWCEETADDPLHATVLDYVTLERRSTVARQTISFLNTEQE
jgi:hypothetical protein